MLFCFVHQHSHVVLMQNPDTSVWQDFKDTWEVPKLNTGLMISDIIFIYQIVKEDNKIKKQKQAKQQSTLKCRTIWSL